MKPSLSDDRRGMGEAIMLPKMSHVETLKAQAIAHEERLKQLIQANRALPREITRVRALLMKTQDDIARHREEKEEDAKRQIAVVVDNPKAVIRDVAPGPMAKMTLEDYKKHGIS